MTLSEAGFAAKRPPILMASSPGAAGLAHSKLITLSVQLLTRRVMFRDIHIYMSYMNWLVPSDQFRQLSLP